MQGMQRVIIVILNAAAMSWLTFVMPVFVNEHCVSLNSSLYLSLLLLIFMLSSSWNNRFVRQSEY